MQSTDDRELLRQYAESRSDEAFSALVARYINLVYSIALRQVGDAHHAEEITQAVFIILARKAAKLCEVKVLSGWLFHATRLTALNFIDRTGLTGRFDIDLRWSDKTDWKTRDKEAIKPVLVDQLGLELAPTREPIEVLVIEKVK